MAQMPRGATQGSGMVRQQPRVSWAPRPGLRCAGQQGRALLGGWGWTPECAAHPGEGSGERGGRVEEGPQEGLCTASPSLRAKEGAILCQEPASLVRSGLHEHPPHSSLLSPTPTCWHPYSSCQALCSHRAQGGSASTTRCYGWDHACVSGPHTGTCGPRQQRGPLAEHCATLPPQGLIPTSLRAGMR